MNAYLDSSALVKLLRAEPGHDVIAGTREEAGQLASSVIAYAEARAAIARSRSVASTRLRRSLDALWRELVRMHVDDELALEAGALAERHRIRGMDAVHLASALRFEAASAPEAVVFASWDHDQRVAARAEGLALTPRDL